MTDDVRVISLVLSAGCCLLLWLNSPAVAVALQR